ncbi:MAG: GspE/PulE family protein [Phycisphaerales bacterium]
MSKRDIDAILAELGIDADHAAAHATRRALPPAAGSGTPAPAARRHAIDEAEDVFSIVPAVPAGQRSFNKNIIVENDPAVPTPAAPTAPPPHPGESLSDVYQPDAPLHDSTALAVPTELGQLLVHAAAATASQVTTAQQVIRQSPGKRLIDVLVEQGCDEAKLQRCVAQLACLPFESIDLHKGLDGGFDGKMLQRLSPEFCRSKQIVPLRLEGSRVVLGVTRPDDVFLFDEVRQKLGVSGIKPVVVTAFEVRGVLELVAGQAEKKDDVDVSAILSEVQEGDVQLEKKSNEEVDLEKEAGESPVIRYVNYIIQTASKEGASDIHIEPGEKKLKVRFRIDGELYEMMNPPVSMASAITSRLKIMANLDISERRLPQDGRIRCTVQGRKLDLRMSTLPVAAGEKTVMRILDTRSISVKLEELGFDADTLTIWKGLVELPHGIVLVTGPTGSGKTTTLYASLRQLDKNSMNVSTVEDPIEYHLDGITQTQTHEKIGMTFAKALKALLRQDPDVIMLGEIRDHETAVTAVQAALTGHLVLSTLHTNDAPSSITRLVNIGLEPFLVAAAVNGVLAQRLLRRLCPHCKQETTPTEQMKEFLEIQGMNTDKLWTHKGCDKCRNTGYSGRVGIYELLRVDDTLRDMIVRSPNVSELRRFCTERGMANLRADGLKKAATGQTSVEEVLRVTESTI